MLSCARSTAGRASARHSPSKHRLTAPPDTTTFTKPDASSAFPTQLATAPADRIECRLCSGLIDQAFIVQDLRNGGLTDERNAIPLPTMPCLLLFLRRRSYCRPLM